MRDDVEARPIVWVAFTIGAVVVLVIVAVFLLLHLWNTDPGEDRVRGMPGPVAVPGPALESAPQPEMAAYLAQKQQLLQTTGWVDAQRGIARIPIADAMALLAASGAKR
jgi:hypothetical protein